MEFQSKDAKIKVVQDDAILFLSKLPGDSVDVIVTDPAYSGMNNQLMLGNGRIVGKYAAKGKKSGKWFEEFADSKENYSEFLSECRRVLNKKTGHIYIMFDSFSLLTLGPLVRKYLDVKNIITWDKVNMGMGHYYRRRHEYVIFATAGNNRKLSAQTFPDVWEIKRIHRAAYPTQKPVEVFDRMLEASAQKDFVVCDPFLGSGSSAISAIQHACEFIGCDISARAFGICKERIEKFLATGKDPLQIKARRPSRR